MALGSQGYDGHLQLSETKLIYHHLCVLMTSFLDEDQNDLHQQ